MYVVCCMLWTLPEEQRLQTTLLYFWHKEGWLIFFMKFDPKEDEHEANQRQPRTPTHIHFIQKKEGRRVLLGDAVCCHDWVVDSIVYSGPVGCTSHRTHVMHGLNAETQDERGGTLNDAEERVSIAVEAGR